ncbi:MAG: hypothetical protein OXI63_20880, partial [Candidatus Poribacteria bacterium]|nr:hypothetical protein [Candidatus Poribacteria bacterium]
VPFNKIVIVSQSCFREWSKFPVAVQIEGDNTETNKRYKFDQVFDEILLSFVNSKFDRYTKLSKPEINADLKHQLYQAYLEQLSSPS